METNQYTEKVGFEHRENVQGKHDGGRSSEPNVESESTLNNESAFADFFILIYCLVLF